MDTTQTDWQKAYLTAMDELEKRELLLNEEIEKERAARQNWQAEAARLADRVCELERR